MSEQLKGRLLGIFLLMMSVLTWVWMLGGLKYFFVNYSEFPKLLQSWTSPGLLSVPILVSIITTIFGLLYFFGILPIPDKDETNQILVDGEDGKPLSNDPTNDLRK